MALEKGANLVSTVTISHKRGFSPPPEGKHMLLTAPTCDSMPFERSSINALRTVGGVASSPPVGSISSEGGSLGRFAIMTTLSRFMKSSEDFQKVKLR